MPSSSENLAHSALDFASVQLDMMSKRRSSSILHTVSCHMPFEHHSYFDSALEFLFCLYATIASLCLVNLHLLWKARIKDLSGNGGFGSCYKF